MIYQSKRKAAKLLQQPGGAPRFGKRSSHLCSVYQRARRNASFSFSAFRKNIRRFSCQQKN